MTIVYRSLGHLIKDTIVIMGGGESLILVTPTWNLSWTLTTDTIDEVELDVWGFTWQITAHRQVFYPPEKQYWAGSNLSQLETNIKRQATRQDCLPSLLGDGHKWNEVCGEDSLYILYWADSNSQGRTKISCTSTTSTMNQPWKDPFHM